MKSGNYTFPSSELLEEHEEKEKHEATEKENLMISEKIKSVLTEFGIGVTDVSVCVSPSVTLYKVVPKKGVRISAIKNIEEDIAFALKTRSVRVVRLSDSVGIEVANDHQSVIPLKAMLSDEAFTDSKAELPVAMGVDIFNKVKVFDLADAPHLLIAGATKQGKTVGLNVVITSLLYAKHPSELKFVLIDPKMVEFPAYSKLLKHYLAVLPDTADEKKEMDNAIVRSPKQAEDILRSICVEMDKRHQLLKSAKANGVKEYNAKYRDGLLRPEDGHHFLPYIVVVIDEYADLTIPWGMGIKSGFNHPACPERPCRRYPCHNRHAASVSGCHHGPHQGKFPDPHSVQVSTRADSATILDSPGAERLIGKGDMLYYAGVETVRMQCAYISHDEISAVTKHIASQTESTEGPYILPKPHDEANEDEKPVTEFDPLFEEIAEYVVKRAEVSVSDLQRKFAVGYCRSCRIMEQLESAGIVSPETRKQSVLVKGKKDLDKILSEINRPIQTRLS